MAPTPDSQTRVATVGSPSSNFQVTLDLTDKARDLPLVGSVLYLENPMGEGSELAIGTVTEVVTTNRWHEDPTFRGVVRTSGEIAGMSGDDGDVRQATIRLQAAWRRTDPTCPWASSGPSLRMSPATGTPIGVVSDDLINALVSQTPDLHYMGHLAGTEGVRLPLSLPDYSGPLGAWMGACFGQTGSGKALDCQTPIPSPHGWTLMGDIKDGDVVFDENGQPCRVTKAHDVMYDRPCYEVEFSDGSVIVADAEHLWYTETSADRARASRYRTQESRRKRRPLISHERIDALRAEAALASADDVITRRELSDLSGLLPDSSAIETVLRQVGPAGDVTIQVKDVARRDAYQRSRAYPGYPARDLLTALIGQCKPTRRLFDEAMAERLRLLVAQTPAEQRLTLAGTARMLGLKPRNSELARKVKATGVQPETTVVVLDVPPEKTSRLGRKFTITTYPRALVLTALADHCSAPLRDQRDKRTVIGGVYTTREIAQSLRAGRGSANHAIPVARPLSLPQARGLLIDPYALGVWLGDGRSAGFQVTTADPEIVTRLEATGLMATKVGDIEYAFTLPGASRTWDKASTCPTCGRHFDRKRRNQTFCSKGCMRRTGAAPQPLPACVFCGDPVDKSTQVSHAGCRARSTMTGRLRLLGVLNNKHIPAVYLRGSEDQRRALLAGLLDTDGTASKTGAVHFDNTNKALADGVVELAASLGYRPTVTTKQVKKRGGGTRTSYRVAFTTSDCLFQLTRKRSAQEMGSARYNASKNSHRYIVDVRPVDSRPVRCITVDSPSRLYLAGETMIPTHNTAASAFLLAGQLRHRDHGMVIVDPQGQWASEEGFVFSVQGFAAEMGRDVVVRRISDDLRLEKSAPLLVALLAHTQLAKEFGLKSGETQDYMWGEVEKWVRKQDDWETEESRSLMTRMLEYLRTDAAVSRIYSTKDNQDRFKGNITAILDDDELLGDALDNFAPIHNLFQSVNPSGTPRHSLWGALSAVFERDPARPAPLLILDMSSRAMPGLDEQVDRAAERAYEILEKDTVKAAILRNLFSTLKRASEDKFRAGQTLNTMIVLDEAWRYAAPPVNASSDEVAALSSDLAGYARDTRKFGIGWFFISQSPRSINNDIWAQLSVRLFGYGLGGSDLEKMVEILDDRDSLRLYRGFAPPRSTGRYPFLLTGPISPLAVTNAPVALHVYTDFDAFRTDNSHWIAPARQAMGEKVLTGAPKPPTGSSGSGRARPRPRPAAGDTRKALVESGQAARENRAAVGMRDAAGFADPLASLDDDPPF